MKGMSKVLSAALILLSIPGFNSPEAQNPRISEWVEDAPASDNSKIALGYPVPIPVDTPLPFAGFRSYSGLHTRHQDLANTSPWSHAIELGNTRNGRTIWIYQLGDADHLTAYGVPEQAMLTNGGIHAREWQSPEVATGIIELLVLAEDDDHLISYLRDNTNVMVIPVLNVDGFLQTQRTPSKNWMGTDPDDPEYSPRDGRMRRKNMLGPDEDLLTRGDHLFGVDLNRNNPPYWATNPNRSSAQPGSIVHHGASAHSEPETQALEAAATLAPANRLSMYTDLHSFSQVHAWVRNDNNRLASLTEKLLGTFSNHHVAFDAGKYYWFDGSNNVPRNQGIGLTEEYFTHNYQVPSWTLEIEPSQGHPDRPGNGADYGGLSRNGHDGFILPDSEVERVRTELAQSFTVAYYQQSGPPSIVAARFIDAQTGAVVFEGEWDVSSETTRDLYSYQAQPLQLDRDYTFWLAYDKPMRWRNNGEVDALPGQPISSIRNLSSAMEVGGNRLTANFARQRWLDEPGEAPAGYLRYRDDALATDFRIPADDNNNSLVSGTAIATLLHLASDMTSSQVDADPSSVARWENGGWTGYENSEGQDHTDSGGTDSSIQLQVTSDPLGDPFVIEAGISSAWYDRERSGEGFMLEILPDNRAVMYWFTYDGDGNQDWYIATGQIRGNRILFPQMVQVSGGEFGPGFDPGKVTRSVVGSASFIWSGCDSGVMDWLIDKDGDSRRHGRMNLHRLTRVMGIDCGMLSLPPEIAAGRLSGSWYDFTHSGEGYVLEVLIDRRVLVYWFSYDPQGERRWFYGIGKIEGDKIVFNDMRTTSGGIFGAGFDPDQVVDDPWGTLELELDCASGTARFTPTEAGFPAGTLNLNRLTLLDGLSCD